MSRTFAFALAASLLIGMGSAQAAWVEIDTFESFAAGDTINGVNGWTVGDSSGDSLNNAAAVDPTDSSNMVLNVFAENTGGEANFKSAAIANGSTGTLFFRFYIPAGATPDLSIGTSPASGPYNGTDLAATFRVNSYTAQAFNEGAWEDLGALACGTWYDVWMVVANDDAGASDWDVYINGGAWTEQTQLGSGFDFRADPAGGDLLNFVARANNSHEDDSTLFDDIYLDATGENLSVVPEPATMTMTLIGLVGGAVRARRRR